MTKLVRQGGQAEDRASIGHHDEGMRTRRAPGKSAVALALVGIYVYPAFLQATVAQDAHILFSHREQSLCNPIHGLFEGNGDAFLCQGGPHIVRLEGFQSQRLAPDLEIALPDGDVFLKDLDQVVEHRGRDVMLVEHHIQGRVVMTHPASENGLLDGSGQIGRQRVLVLQQGGVIIFPDGLACSPVRARSDFYDAGLVRLDGISPAISSGLGLQICVGQHAGRSGRPVERIGQQAHYLFDFPGADVFLHPEQIVEEVSIDGQSWLSFGPAH